MTLRLEQLDLATLAEAVDQNDGPGAYVDPATGEGYPCSDDGVCGVDGDQVDVDETDWLPIGGDGSRGPYRDMEWFATELADRALGARLVEALAGRGAFRRFRDVIWHAPEETSRAWQRFRNARAELRVLDWAELNQLVALDELEAARAVLHGQVDEVLTQISGRRAPNPVVDVGPVVDVAEKLSRFSEHWSPKVVATLNDYEIKLVKLQGEFVWHTHEDTDELFLVIGGRLTIQLRGGDVTLQPGQLFVVPAGVEHCPVAEGEVSAMLIEPRGTVNTGGAGGELTATYDASLLDS